MHITSFCCLEFLRNKLMTVLVRTMNYHVPFLLYHSILLHINNFRDVWRWPMLVETCSMHTPVTFKTFKASCMWDGHITYYVLISGMFFCFRWVTMIITESYWYATLAIGKCKHYFHFSEPFNEGCTKSDECNSVFVSSYWAIYLDVLCRLYCNHPTRDNIIYFDRSGL